MRRPVPGNGVRVRVSSSGSPPQGGFARVAGGSGDARPQDAPVQLGDDAGAGPERFGEGTPLPADFAAGGGMAPPAARVMETEGPEAGEADGPPAAAVGEGEAGAADRRGFRGLEREGVHGVFPEKTGSRHSAIPLSCAVKRKTAEVRELLAKKLPDELLPAPEVRMSELGQEVGTAPAQSRMRSTAVAASETGF